MPLKKTNGLYRGKVRIGVTQDGKPIDKFVSGKTVKELEVAKEAARDHFIYGRAIPKNVQFFEYAEQWYKLKKEPFISAASRASYNRIDGLAVCTVLFDSSVRQMVLFSDALRRAYLLLLGIRVNDFIRQVTGMLSFSVLIPAIV